MPLPYPVTLFLSPSYPFSRPDGRVETSQKRQPRDEPQVNNQHHYLGSELWRTLSTPMERVGERGAASPGARPPPLAGTLMAMHKCFKILHVLRNKTL